MGKEARVEVHPKGSHMGFQVVLYSRKQLDFFQTNGLIKEASWIDSVQETPDEGFVIKYEDGGPDDATVKRLDQLKEVYNQALNG